MQVICDNIGDAKKGANYWIGANFVLLAYLDNTDSDALPASSFGKVTFKQDIKANGLYSELDQSQGSVGTLPVFLTDSESLEIPQRNYNDNLYGYRLNKWIDNTYGYNTYSKALWNS